MIYFKKTKNSQVGQILYFRTSSTFYFGDTTNWKTTHYCARWWFIKNKTHTQKRHQRSYSWKVPQDTVESAGLWYSPFHSVSYKVIGWMGLIKWKSVGLIPNMSSTYCSLLSQTALQLTGSAQKALYDVHLTCGEEQRSHRDWLHCSTSPLAFSSPNLCVPSLGSERYLAGLRLLHQRGIWGKIYLWVHLICAK